MDLREHIERFGYAQFITVVMATAGMFQKAHAQSTDSVKTEVKSPVSETAADDGKTYSMQALFGTDTAAKTDADTLSQEALKQIRDAKIDSICADMQRLEYKALCLIGISEDIKMQAYWDRTAKLWTIGIGNITHPNGVSVKRGDILKNEADLVSHFRSFFKNKVAPHICDYLKSWKKLKDNEKLALMDLFWNAGGGKLYDTVTDSVTGEKCRVQSPLARAIDAFAASRSKQNRDSVVYRMKTCFKRQDVPALQKRSNFRCHVFTGELPINGEGENSIDLSKVRIGAVYQTEADDNGRELANKIKDFNSVAKTDTVPDTIAKRAALAVQYKSKTQTRRLPFNRKVRARRGSRGR